MVAVFEKLIRCWKYEAKWPKEDVRDSRTCFVSRIPTIRPNSHYNYRW